MRIVPRWLWWWVVGVGACVTVVTAAGWVAGDLMARRFSGFALTSVPRALPVYQPLDLAAAWRTVHTRQLSLRAPAALIRRQMVSSAPEAVILTDRRQQVWLSVQVRPLEHRWMPWWYRWCLYARRNPIGLLGKALLVPPLGTSAPQMLDQRLGPWQGYLYVAPHRVVAELFDDAHHVTAVVVARQEARFDLDLARAIFASLHVRG